MPAEIRSPVLILGAGINGAAIARELTLNGISVVVVDPGDIASGATAYSSRLAHGGLRYLEYGEFDLVRESLEERNRWLRLAPHLVRPLRFVIPASSRFGGLWQAATRFFGLPGWLRSAKPRPRGIWTIRLGLWFYDRFAGEKANLSRMLPAEDRLPIVPALGRRQCEYGDAQLLYPERFTISLFQDAARAARETASTLTIHTYRQAKLVGEVIEIIDVTTNAVVETIRPALIIDAAGSWVDEALKNLPIAAPRMMAGTQGSHAITAHAGLKHAIGDRAVYAEASDGRPVFILPFAERILIGTTDLPFTGDPATAIASESELDYLTRVVRDLFPQLDFQRTDLDQHYSGVRPLPFVDVGSTAAVTRRHWHAEIAGAPMPCYAIIGGKLTTCRSLAEETTATVLKRLGLPLRETTGNRTLTGKTLAENIEPPRASPESFAEEKGIAPDVAGELARFYGDELPRILKEQRDAYESRVDGTNWPVTMIREIIEREWVERLEDLVERRLMFVFSSNLRRDTIAHLARILGESKNWNAARIEQEARDCIATLARRYGKIVE